MPAFARFSALLLCISLLSACGGGGGGDSGSSSSPTVGDISLTDEEDVPTLTISLNGTDSDGSIKSFTLKNLPAAGQLYLDAQLTTTVNSATPYPATTNNLVLFYVPPANFNGNTRFNYIAVDNDNLNSNEAEVLISLSPVNDAPQLVTNSLAIAEGQTKLISVTELNASDVDNTASELSFTISNETNGQFERVATPGNRITTFTQVDIEAGRIQFVHNGSEMSPSYDVSISDGIISNTALPASITYSPANDNPPVFTSANTISIAENTATVITLAATDVDGDTLSYSIVSGGEDNALFALNNKILSFTSAPDFENPQDADKNNVYRVLVGASDGLTTTTQLITITVTNINDNVPVFTSASSITVDENQTNIQTASATDADQDGIVYSLESGSGGEDNSLVTINSSTGAISFITAPDYEAPSDSGANNNYKVLLGANDGTTTTKHAITITINNLNDNNPVFTSPNRVNVEQNTTTVQTITATDSDNDTLSYSLQNGTGGEDNPLFNINTSSGLLSFKTAPVSSTPADADGNNIYQVLVGVNDGASTVTQAITIKVTPIGLPFTENFSSGSDGWVFFNDYSKSANWTVTSGKLVQSLDFGISNVTKELDETFHRGTYAYLSAGIPLIDYRLSADLTPIKQAGYSVYDDGHDIGLMFRFQDNDNYYRIVLNSEYGYTRLDRKLAGVFNTLAVDARGYTDEGVLIHIDVELIGDLIQVYINGDPRFAVQDNSLLNGSVAVYTEDGARFDNIVISDNSNTPSIVISEPEAFTAIPGSVFNVSAVALNVPDTANVEFDLDGSVCGSVTQASPGFYTASCTAVSAADHTITATLLDGAAIASDSNQKVSSSAEIRLVVGDSLSNGVTDTIRNDNQSSDGKIIGEQGYVAILHDLLNVSRAAPQMLYNEAVPGDESWELDQRLPSILARHPEANIAQVLIGTNDAGQSLPIPSGLGCSGTACNGTYKENMQNVINTLTASGVTPIIALIPPAFDDPNPLTSSRNVLTQEYNTVLKSDLSIPARGPDMFNYFLSASENRISMFADDLHFNGLGYVMMAELWEHYLNGSTSLPSRSQLRLVYEDICVRLVSTSCQDPLQYKQDLMQTGIPYYIDAAHTLQSIPAVLNGGIWLLTANVDNTNGRDDYLTFTIDRNVTLYVAYDAAATSLPNWMSGFTDSGQTLTTTNPSAPTMKIYSRSYIIGVDTATDGTIQLGANLAAGAAGSNANYLVIMKQQ